jgi:pimeloyl-ACP methyl ester carboxylesterase
MTQFATLGDGRRLAFDDVGRPDGFPVVYLHGCPNARLSRHPDDELATRAGARLIAVDRPGYGESDAPADASLLGQANDLAGLLAALGIERCGVLAWSAGAPAAVALAHVAPDRVASVAIACGTLPNPSEPLTDDEVAEIVSLMVPDELTYELALEMTREGATAEHLRDLDSVPGLDAQLARATVAGVAGGTTGVAGDIRAQTTPWPFELAEITVPFSLWYGECDPVAPPSVGQQFADTLDNATFRVVPGASHLLPLVHWSALLDELGLTIKENSCR